MTDKKEIFRILDTYKKCEYTDHSVLIPVLDWMKEFDGSAYDSFRRLLNREYLSIGAEIASELMEQRQLKLDI